MIYKKNAQGKSFLEKCKLNLYPMFSVIVPIFSKIYIYGAKFYGASCQCGELSMGRNVLGELSMRRVVHGASCLWGEMSVERVVMGQVRWGEMSVGRVSMGRVVRGASFDGASCPGVG